MKNHNTDRVIIVKTGAGQDARNIGETVNV